MHQLIAIIVEAESAEIARSIGKGLFMPGRRTATLTPPFDSGKLMTNEDARYTGSVPDVVQEKGAIRADTEAGQQLIEGRWEAQLKELRRYYSVVEAAIERDTVSLADILNDVCVDNVDVEPWKPLGLSFEDGEGIETASERVLYAMYQVSRDKGPSIHLYDKNGWGIKGSEDYDRLLNEIDAAGATDSENHYYVVPADVKS